MKKTAIVTLLVMSVSLCSFGQSFTPEKRVLVPIYISGMVVPGAYGSIWLTDLVGHNASDVMVDVGGPGCVLPEGCGSSRAPHSTFALNSLGPVANPNGGMFLYVGLPSAVGFSLRIRDLSRQSLTWGTAIPVVRFSETYTGTLRLLDVPIDDRFRNALRIYDFNYSTGRSVRLRIFDERATTAVIDTVLTIPVSNERETDSPTRPNAIYIGNLVAAFPVLATLQPVPVTGGTQPPRVRIEIEPISPDLQFWAFVSVTNNEAQHVTVITPDPPPQ